MGCSQLVQYWRANCGASRWKARFITCWRISAWVKDLGIFAAVQADGHFFTRAKGARVGYHHFQRDCAAFGAEQELFLGLDKPQRAQPQRIYAGNDRVAKAGQDSRRTLGIRAKGLADARVNRPQLGRELLEFVRHGREDGLHGFGQVQPEVGTHGVEGAVYILRVGPVVGQDGADLFRFQAQAGDGIDFAVMAQQGKGLGALEIRDGVGRIAGVAQHHRGIVIAVLQIGVIARKRLYRAAHFIDHHVRAERQEMDGELGLQLASGLRAGAFRRR